MQQQVGFACGQGECQVCTLTQDRWLKVICVSSFHQGKKSEMLILVVPVMDVSFLPTPGRKKMSFLENVRFQPIALRVLLWVEEGTSWSGGGEKLRKADFVAMKASLSLHLRLQEITPPLFCSMDNTNFPRLVRMKIFSYQHISSLWLLL